MNMNDKYSKEHVKKRRSRCGQCGPCQVKEDCGKCKYCLNKQVLKQSCMYRKCLYLRCKPAHELSRVGGLDSSFSEGELSKSTSSEFGLSSPTSSMPPSPMYGAPMWSQTTPASGCMTTQVMSPFVPIAEAGPANEMVVAAVDPVFPVPVSNWNAAGSGEVKVETELSESSYGSAPSQQQQQQQQQAQQSYVEQIKTHDFLHSKPIPSPHPVIYGHQQPPHPGMPPPPMGDPRASHLMGHPQNLPPGYIPGHPMNGLQPHIVHGSGVGWAMPTCSEHLYPMGYPRTSVPQIGGPLLAGLGPPPSPSIMPAMEIWRHGVSVEVARAAAAQQQQQREGCSIIAIDNTAIPAYVQTDGLNNVEITTVPSSATSGKDILSAAIEESGISDLAQQASMEPEYSAISAGGQTGGEMLAHQHRGNHVVQHHYQHHAVPKSARLELASSQGIVLQQNLGAGGEIQINLPSNGIMVENVTIDDDMAKYTTSNSEMLMYPNDIFAHQVM